MKSKLNSYRRKVSHWISYTMVSIARYSTSIDDLETLACFLDFQKNDGVVDENIILCSWLSSIRACGSIWITKCLDSKRRRSMVKKTKGWNILYVRDYSQCNFNMWCYGFVHELTQLLDWVREIFLCLWGR